MVKSWIILVAALGGVFGAPPPGQQNWRVVGGSNAPDGAYPYQVSIRDKSGSHFCGGSIIKPTIILTAAHCTGGVTSPTISVVAGTNQLKSGGTTYLVKDIRPHENYNPFTIENDISIIKLSSSIEYTDKISPIDLETGEVGVGVDAVLSGWGLTSYPGSTPNDLQHIILKTIGIDVCKDSHKNPVFDSQVCTLTQRGEGACQGDSGGPLVANGRQIGIVSWGRPCAVNYPDVFTKVSHYGEWIKRNSY